MGWVLEPRVAVDAVYRGHPGQVIVIRPGGHVVGAWAKPWWHVPGWYELMTGKPAVEPAKAARPERWQGRQLRRVWDWVTAP